LSAIMKDNQKKHGKEYRKALFGNLSEILRRIVKRALKRIG
jgi:hypothetical protein